MTEFEISGMTQQELHGDPPKLVADVTRPSGSSTQHVIAERAIEAPLTSACPTCGGLIGKYEDVGLVDGEWVCAGCFTFDPA